MLLFPLRDGANYFASYIHNNHKPTLYCQMPRKITKFKKKNMKPSRIENRCESLLPYEEALIMILKFMHIICDFGILHNHSILN